jgi:hypothetical protein
MFRGTEGAYSFLSCRRKKELLLLKTLLLKMSMVNFLFKLHVIKPNKSKYENKFDTDDRAGVAYAIDGKLLNTAAGMFAPTVEQNLNDRTDDAILVPQRFASNSRAPFVLVQCTWDLPPDKCKECLYELTKIVTDITVIKTDGQRKSYSCTVRYSNTSFMVVPLTAPASAPPPRSIDVPTDLPPPASSTSSSRE